MKLFTVTTSPPAPPVVVFTPSPGTDAKPTSPVGVCPPPDVLEVELEELEELDELLLLLLVVEVVLELLDEELDELPLDDVVVELLLDEELDELLDDDEDDVVVELLLDDDEPPQLPAVAVPLTVNESIFAICVEPVAWMRIVFAPPFRLILLPALLQVDSEAVFGNDRLLDEPFTISAELVEPVLA